MIASCSTLLFHAYFDVEYGLGWILDSTNAFMVYDYVIISILINFKTFSPYLFEVFPLCSSNTGEISWCSDFSEHPPHSGIFL